MTICVHTKSTLYDILQVWTGHLVEGGGFYQRVPLCTNVIFMEYVNLITGGLRAQSYRKYTCM